MALWRGSRKLTGYIALFALLLQLVCGFAHFHHEWLGPSGIASASHVGSGEADDPDGHHGQQSDRCVVCTAVSLANAFALPTPPAVPTPIAHAISPLETPIDGVAAVTRHHAFNSRAPPSV